mmetsp:Transcript_14977/g.62333  ORF Transcript_14977/g.62333 Transcript_14977/m.62333 type:complete len:356 (-) Transcript_14977:81-1148(-)
MPQRSRYSAIRSSCMVNWLKMSTFEPSRRSLGSSLLRKSILPLALTSGSDALSWPGAGASSAPAAASVCACALSSSSRAPSMENGWLQTLRSCMHVLRSAGTLRPRMSAPTEPSRSARYHTRCAGVSSTFIMTSSLAGSSPLPITSSLVRRSRSGCSMRRMDCTCRADVTWPKFPCHSSSSPNVSSSSRLSSENSSRELFCTGVPVSSSRWSRASSCTLARVALSMPLRRCASSTTTQRQCTSASGGGSSARSASKLVSTTCSRGASPLARRPPGCHSCSTTASRLGREPPYVTTSRWLHAPTSRSQCPNVDTGATTRNGPVMRQLSARLLRKVTVCAVLPRPISSPRMHDVRAM